MLTTLIILHVFICVLLVITVLLQFGKGAEVGAIMGGSGASQAIFSSSSKGNFFTKLTTFLAIGFMVNSIVLSTLKSREAKNSLFDSEAPVAKPLNSDVVPATPSTTDAAKTNAAEEVKAEAPATTPEAPTETKTEKK